MKKQKKKRGLSGRLPGGGPLFPLSWVRAGTPGRSAFPTRGIRPRRGSQVPGQRKRGKTECGVVRPAVAGVPREQHVEHVRGEGELLEPGEKPYREPQPRNGNVHFPDPDTGRRRDPVNQLVVRETLRSADVECDRFGVGTGEAVHDPLDHIPDEHGLQEKFAVARNGEKRGPAYRTPQFGEELVTRPEDPARPENGPGKARLPDDLLRLPLRVEIPPGAARGRPERAHVHEPRYPPHLRRVHGVPGGLHVSLLERDAPRRELPDDARQVHDRLGALGCVLHELPVRDVARGHPARAPEILRDAVLRADADEEAGEVPPGDQGAAYVPSQKSRPPGDEYLLEVEKRNLFHGSEMPAGAGGFGAGSERLLLPPHRLYGIYTVGPFSTGTPVSEKEEAMPTYSFECRKCKKKFLEILSFSEYEEGKRKCPKCGSKDVFQVLETFYAKTSRKS